MAGAGARARPLVLYLRSRHVPAALAAALGSTAALWAVAAVVDDPIVDRTLGMSAVGVGIAVATPGFGGADTDLERTAALNWPPRRAVHVTLVVVAALAMVAGTALSGRPLAPPWQVARNAAGTGGLAALASSTVGTSRAWIPPMLWTTAASRVAHLLAPAADQAGYVQAIAWPDQPAGSGPAAATAAVLGVVGTAAYALLGPRR